VVGPEIDDAADAGDRLRGVGCLVDQHAADDFGRVQVVLDTAVVAHAKQFAAVERRSDVVLIEAAHRDTAGAAIAAFAGHTRHPGQGFRDTGIRQLADVFSGNGFDDRSVVTLGVDGVYQAALEPARDDDFLHDHAFAVVVVADHCILVVRQYGTGCRQQHADRDG